jgi:hypothetical protein
MESPHNTTDNGNSTHKAQHESLLPSSTRNEQLRLPKTVLRRPNRAVTIASTMGEAVEASTSKPPLQAAARCHHLSSTDAPTQREPTTRARRRPTSQRETPRKPRRGRQHEGRGRSMDNTLNRVGVAPRGDNEI